MSSLRGLAQWIREGCDEHDQPWSFCDDEHIEAAFQDRFGAQPAALDVSVLARAMNDVEQRADLSMIVESNPGTHRPDCIHAQAIAAAYNAALTQEAEKT